MWVRGRVFQNRIHWILVSYGNGQDAPSLGVLHVARGSLWAAHRLRLVQHGLVGSAGVGREVKRILVSGGDDGGGGIRRTVLRAIRAIDLGRVGEGGPVGAVEPSKKACA